MTDSTAPTLSSLIPVTIESEMKKSYLEYAMSVIVSRALPDCRDGLKPVQRRILYAMHALNNYHDKPYKKSAKVVGEVIGNYHPHGDSAIYMALVRMAQDFSLREPLIDGQGNFGSMDGDSPAAMRYTEVRLSKLAAKILEDITQHTVDFQDNYDGSTKEPKVLPSHFPNILVNGAAGIAVGMATSIPTHNLGEVIDACCAYIKNPEITIGELIQIVPAPDFPTGGLILGQERAKNALLTGRGSIVLRSRTEFEEIGGRNAIVVKEIPYQVNKAELQKAMERLVKEKIVEGIHEIRDESNKLGVRVVIELKKDAVGDVVLNQLFKYTSLQTFISVNMLALNRGMPMLMNLRDYIVAFVEFREEVVRRRFAYQLGKARDRAHALIGLSLAVANIDNIIKIIKTSPDPAHAKIRLMTEAWEAETVIPLLKLVEDYRNELDGNRCKFTDEQASAILDMKLQRLTALEKDKIENELNELAVEIKRFLEILGSQEILFQIIHDELMLIREKFATPRRTEVVIAEDDMDIEDLIQREDMVVTTTMGGYIKRVPLATYRAQRRGGKGRSAMTIYEDDMTTDIISASTHTPLLFFSNKGKVYRMKAYRLPLGSPQSKGRAMVNLLPLMDGEKISNILPIPEDQRSWDDYSIVFATAKGQIRRNDLAAFSSIQSNGKIAIKLDDDDSLIGIAICADNQHVMLCTKEGKALRFPVSALRIFKSRSSDGVRGIKLAKPDDAVVSMTILSESDISIEKREELLSIPTESRMNIALNNSDESALIGKELQHLQPQEALMLAKLEQFILTVTEKGYGKRSSAYEYRITGRGGQGVTNINTSERNGCVVASFPVDAFDEIILITNAGTLIRTKVGDIRITGRNALGVRIMNLKEGEKVISVTRIIGAADEALDEVEDSADALNPPQIAPEVTQVAEVANDVVPE